MHSGGRRIVGGFVLAWIGIVAGVRGTDPVQPGSASTRPGGTPRLSILLITADDLNYDGLGVTGCRIPGITPNLDRLATEGMRFVHAHVTAAVCQPSRSVLMTGRYPYRNGAMGFEPIRRDVPTLQESLRAAGYLNGIFAKVPHLTPIEKFCWDTVVDAAQLGDGRDPAAYYEQAKAFFEKARTAGKPFFLMANAQDPHRPFAGSEGEQRPRPQRRARAEPIERRVAKAYGPADVEVPCFLPDLPEIRRELAQFYTSVHRCDETVGEILRALRETGMADSTMVMFLGDNGMPFPFAKTNCYPASTRTAWIVRWPDRTKPGTVDRRHIISGIDFMPTVLEAAGLPSVPGMDGRSFVPLLDGEEQDGRDLVYTVLHATSARREFPMRCVQDRKYSYIFNAWSDGKTVFQNEARGSPSFKAMEAAAKNDPAIAARVRFFSYRVPEELYDVEKDPCALHNRIDDPDHAAAAARLRGEMLKIMERTGDPLLEAFKKQVKKRIDTGT